MGAEFSSQGWNRYSYVGNNPLATTDPSGMCFLGCFWKSIFRSPIFRPLVAIAAAATFNFEVLPAIEAPAFATSAGGLALNAGISGGIGGAISTGTLKGALIGAAEGAAFAEVGNLTTPPDTVDPVTGVVTKGQIEFGSPQYFENVAGHALVGSLGSVAAGGNFGSGFLAAGFGALPGPFLQSADAVSGTVVSSVTGGLGSVLGSGKFENGAVTGAFGYLFSGAAGAAANDNQSGLQGVPVLGQLVQGFNWIGNEVQPIIDNLFGGPTYYSASDSLSPSTGNGTGVQLGPTAGSNVQIAAGPIQIFIQACGIALGLTCNVPDDPGHHFLGTGEAIGVEQGDEPSVPPPPNKVIYIFRPNQPGR